MIYSEQLRAARGLLGWNQKKLAVDSGLALTTIIRMESASGPVRGNSTNVWKIQQVMEDAGIIFISENGGGPGVRLREIPG